ncbi:MAG: deoxyhypusine synthase family protein [Candidatus Woesearchaeota archaeon]
MKTHCHTNFEALELLDLKKCYTVNDIIKGLCKCSFGARCLGEITDKIEHIIRYNAKQNIIIFEGDEKSLLSQSLQQFSIKYRFNLMNAEKYVNTIKSIPDNLIVIGRFSEQHEKIIYFGARYNTIFINKERLVIPGQTRDGYFPNVLFTDPNYAIPLIIAAITERFEGKKTTVTEMIKILEKYDGLSKEVANGAKNFSRMVNDPSYTVFMTMSGAMTIAQMSYVVCDMIDNKMIQSLTTTGAAMAHGLVESMGLKHYKYNPKVSDVKLAKQKLNRVTDTLEPETNFDHIEEIITGVLHSIPRVSPITPSMFHASIGKYLAEKFPHERGILKSAYENNVPVFVPAFFDSELGNDITTYNLIQKNNKNKPVIFDLESENHKLVKMVQDAKRVGLFTVGGGVPRNWTQNVAPLIEIIKDRAKVKTLKEKPFSSGVRISPDPLDLGHLSGCTYSEGMTWRKMDPNGSFVEIHADATYVWPIIIKYAMENLVKK